MQPDTMKIWTRSAIRASLGKILVESFGVDEGAVSDEAALVRDLGAESIDFLDISFKCQQTYGVDLPARLIQDRMLEWRDLTVLSAVVGARYGTMVAADELRTVAPATVPAILDYLQTRHGLVTKDDEAATLSLTLAERLLGSLDGMGLDLSDLEPAGLARHLLENLHSPTAFTEVMNRFTVRALTEYLAAQLHKVDRLADA